VRNEAIDCSGDTTSERREELGDDGQNQDKESNLQEEVAERRNSGRRLLALESQRERVEKTKEKQ
jgi:hypothetical protein